MIKLIKKETTIITMDGRTYRHRLTIEEIISTTTEVIDLTKETEEAMDSTGAEETTVSQQSSQEVVDLTDDGDETMEETVVLDDSSGQYSSQTDHTFDLGSFSNDSEQYDSDDAPMSPYNYYDYTDNLNC